MSQAFNDCCACPTPEVVLVPGSPADPCVPCADGDPGINAFTLTTAGFTIPVFGNNVTIAVGVSSWAGVNQPIFISDPAGVKFASFEVVSIPSSTSLEITPYGYAGDSVNPATLDTGSTVSPSGTQPAGPIAIAGGGTGSTTATTARAALGVGGANLSVYASGTAYQLTNTSALLDFGTTDPTLTITSAGVWLILARARIDYTGATFAAVRTGTLKLRRTNNTAADLANSSGSFLTDIITTLTYTLAVIDLQPIIYTTTNSNDVIELWGDISVVPTAGSIDASEASIVAIKLYDQTV